MLYLGVLTERRNALFLLDAARELKTRGVDFRLTAIGQFEDESYKARFWRTVAECGLEERVRHVPSVEQKDLPEVYGKADLFLLPTRYDIFGMVLLEAMHFGKAVLTTDNGGSDMLIRDGENGCVMDGFDPGAWADRICLLAENPGLRRAMGRAAKETVDTRFTWDALAGGFLEAFDDYLGKRP